MIYKERSLMYFKTKQFCKGLKAYTDLNASFSSLWSCLVVMRVLNQFLTLTIIAGYSPPGRDLKKKIEIPSRTYVR